MDADGPPVHETVSLSPSSPDFHFPYETPYEIQQSLMRHLYDALRRAQVTIVESPTGTGKSLSLISAACTFLYDFKKQARIDFEAKLRRQAEEGASGEPSWVLENDVKLKLDEWDRRERELEERLERIRQSERAQARQEQPSKRQKTNHDPSSTARMTAEHFAPDSLDDVIDENTDPSSNLSASVRAMMEKFEASRSGRSKEDDEPVDVTKIYFTSRTHSQLSQFISELRKTRWAKGDDKSERPMRVIPLGSRQNLCINDDVRKKSAGSNEALGDLCKDLQKQTGEARCPYLPPADEPAWMNNFRDRALADVRDIEDIEDLGRKMKVCPYYGTRKAVPSAELVTLPYNMLMSKTTREAMGISLQGHVVLIDEAHNLIDTILSMHSVSITTTVLKTLLQALTAYMNKFRSRLKGINAVSLEKLKRYMDGLDQFAASWANESEGWSKNGSKKDGLLSVNEVLGSAKGSLDQINVTELDKYLQDTKIARKIGGYLEFLEDAATAKGRKVARSDATRNFHRLQAFLMCLANPDRDGRILISAERTTGSSSTEAKTVVTMKYMLLAPADSFRSLVEEARSVVLAGGTMAPISDFREQLVPYLEDGRFSTFSCGHIVPRENVATFALTKGPTGAALEFKFGNRSDERLLDDVGQVISNMSNVTPKGMVVFVPSYGFLDIVKARWTQTGLLDRISRRKTAFWEPKSSSEVEPILSAYAQAVKASSIGAILFAVVGAKLSEGINFADDMARLVVVVGIPYANSQSTELAERMKYLVETSPKDAASGRPKRNANGLDAGQVLYNNLAFRAVNQSIGRAIRHANDWAAIVLIDARYAPKSKQDQLPKWLGQDIKTPESFGALIKSLATFYRTKTSAGPNAST